MKELVPMEVHVGLEYTILFPTEYIILQIIASLLTKPVPEHLDNNIVNTFEDDKWRIQRRIHIRCKLFSMATISKWPFERRLSIFTSVLPGTHTATLSLDLYQSSFAMVSLPPMVRRLNWHLRD